MQQFLLSRLDSMHYAIDASTIKEIFWLPELATVEQAPSYILGLINLRGKIVPVMSLSHRFQRRQSEVNITDRLVVVSIDDVTLGILLSDVFDVVSIPESEIATSPKFHQHTSPSAKFITGEIDFDDQIWMLLDIDTLINTPDGSVNDLPKLSCQTMFEHCSDNDRNIFRRRAKNLSVKHIDKQTSQLQSFVLFELEQELFAVNILLLREFCHLRQHIPIPCCPQHIMGNMNLRGDILTLIDLRSVFGLTSTSALEEVMVLEVDEIRAGIPVTAIMDIVDLLPEQHRTLPVTIDGKRKEFSLSAIPYGARIACVLDLKELLHCDALIVDEEI
jgi:purine-binding chemotaxis protein CheW